MAQVIGGWICATVLPHSANGRKTEEFDVTEEVLTMRSEILQDEIKLKRAIAKVINRPFDEILVVDSLCAYLGVSKLGFIDIVKMDEKLAEYRNRDLRWWLVDAIKVQSRRRNGIRVSARTANEARDKATAEAAQPHFWETTVVDTQTTFVNLRHE